MLSYNLAKKVTKMIESMNANCANSSNSDLKFLFHVFSHNFILKQFFFKKTIHCIFELFLTFQMLT